MGFYGFPGFLAAGLAWLASHRCCATWLLLANQANPSGIFLTFPLLQSRFSLFSYGFSGFHWFPGSWAGVVGEDLVLLLVDWE